MTKRIANNCKKRQIELLIENSINLPSIGMKYLSIRSLILTNDVSITKVTAMAIITIRNFRFSLNFECATFNFCKHKTNLEHKAFV